jgi:hypothetical protein
MGWRIAVLVLLLTATPVQAAYLTYAQWRALPVESRALYIAGAFDSLIGFASDGGDVAVNRHYSNCLAQSHMTNKQLAINVSNFVDGKPELQGKSVQGGLINYLLEMCGAPPQPATPAANE